MMPLYSFSFFLQGDCNKKIDEYEHEVSECRLLITQHEARMKTLQESMMEVEVRKRQLEEQVRWCVR